MKKRKVTKKKAKRSFNVFMDRLTEIGLVDAVQTRSLAKHVSLRDLYEGPRTASVIAARCDVYNWLSKEGKSINEIARIFDRAPNSVMQQIKKRTVAKGAKKAKGRSRNTSGGGRGTK